MLCLKQYKIQNIILYSIYWCCITGIYIIYIN